MHQRLLAVSFLLAGALPVAAQSVWTQLFPAQSPAGRFNHAMAFDAARGVTVLYGGNGTPSQWLGDLWRWDGSNWQQVTLTGPTPGLRSQHAMCYHSARGQVLLVGGNRSSNWIMDTWGWNGTSWQQVIASAGQLNQAQQSLAYDPIRNVVVAFDGLRTCEWNGTGLWVQRTSAQAPATGNCGAMVFDAAAGVSVLFTYGQTWTWDGVNWTRQLPPLEPPQIVLTAMAFDQGRGEAVLFGGYTSSSSNQTWAWNGTAWTQQIAANPPPARHAHAMAYDGQRQRVVMFGGIGSLADTWIKNPSFGTPATTMAFGAGCPGSAGTPALASFGGSLPWIGGNWFVGLQSLPPLIFFAPFGVLGLSRTQWGSVPLPVDLGVFGMPGCSGLVSVDDIAPLVNHFGAALWTIPVPGTAALVGMHVYLQGLVMDPSANAFGMVASNALDCVIGAR